LQWAHAVYFVVTVMTTVGFGDIAALTPLEIAYVCVTMLVGAVVNSIVMSTVMTELMKVSRAEAEKRRRTQTLREFIQHAELSSATSVQLEDWNMNDQKLGGCLDMVEAKFLFSYTMPPSLLGKLSMDLFQGNLIKSSLLSLSGRKSLAVPEKLPLYLATVLIQRAFEMNEVAYRNSDEPLHCFLVVKGTFAVVGVPAITGGKNPPGLCGHFRTSRIGNVRLMSNLEQINTHQLYPYKLFGPKSYFGEYELLHGLRTRNHCARCESQHGGTALVLKKSHLMDLSREFPNFGQAWKSISVRRNQHQESLLKELSFPWTYKECAAQRIQDFVREHLNQGSRASRRSQARPSQAQPSEHSKSRRKGHREKAPDSLASKADIAELSRQVHCLQESVQSILEKLAEHGAAQKLEEHGAAQKLEESVQSILQKFAEHGPAQKLEEHGAAQKLEEHGAAQSMLMN